LGGGDGQDFPPLSGEYLTDLLELNRQENEDAEDEHDGDSYGRDDAAPEWETI
jgi:hypothetical protein